MAGVPFAPEFSAYLSDRGSLDIRILDVWSDEKYGRVRYAILLDQERIGVYELIFKGEDIILRNFTGVIPGYDAVVASKASGNLAILLKRHSRSE